MLMPQILHADRPERAASKPSAPIITNLARRSVNSKSAKDLANSINRGNGIRHVAYMALL